MIVYKSGEFAKMLGVSTQTLARWDKSGLLKAYRTPSNRRYYTEEQYVNYHLRGGVSLDSINSNDKTNDRTKDSD